MEAPFHVIRIAGLGPTNSTRARLKLQDDAINSVRLNGSANGNGTFGQRGSGGSSVFTPVSRLIPPVLLPRLYHQLREMRKYQIFECSHSRNSQSASSKANRARPKIGGEKCLTIHNPLVATPIQQALSCPAQPQALKLLDLSIQLPVFGT